MEAVGLGLADTQPRQGSVCYVNAKDASLKSDRAFLFCLSFLPVTDGDAGLFPCPSSASPVSSLRRSQIGVF